MAASPEPAWTPVGKPLSEYTLPPPCCQRAHERGYRRGYRHGYWYALWDVGALLPIKDALWQQLETFVYETLAAWGWRARTDEKVCREPGPRFRPPRQTRRSAGRGGEA
jgi:hypothetical protein